MQIMQWLLSGRFAVINSDACGSTHGALYRRAESVRVGHILSERVYDVAHPSLFVFNIYDKYTMNVQLSQ